METDYKKYQKSNCRYCNTPLGEFFLDLGLSPLANSLPLATEQEKEEFLCPLRLVKCSTCHLVQLNHVLPPEMMFSDYLYVSSTTKTFRDHFVEYAKSLKTKLKKKSGVLAVDIGSNDGLLLSCYQQEGIKAVGVEPAKNLSDHANSKGLLTLNNFFNASCVEQILSQQGKADIISGNNVFAHIDDIQSVLKNVHALLDPEGIFVIEFPYLVTMVEKMFFDMIYHEHLSYISVNSLNYVLRRFGFEIFSIARVTSHGGSLRVFIQKKSGPYQLSSEVQDFINMERVKGYENNKVYQVFADDVHNVKTRIKQFVSETKKQRKSISGYGAPAKATTLINYCELNNSQIDFVADDNPLKQNRLVPGVKIPIVPGTHLQKNPTDYVIIFAWNFTAEILSKLSPLKNKGVRFVIPLPEVRMV